MEVKVVGKVKRPYTLNGKSRISCRLSLCAGDYLSDDNAGIEADGVRYIEVWCPVDIADCLRVNDEIFVELDDHLTRIKSAMIKTDGGYVPTGR